MRLWHEDLIPKLPRQQLLGQHRECCALRGNGWSKKHATVNYVFSHKLEFLVAYHLKVIEEMQLRGYNASAEWLDYNYRGKACGKAKLDLSSIDRIKNLKPIYREHDNNYLLECIENLKSKGIELEEERK
jgi:uncharacterized protein (TIGR02328 family)